MKPVPLHLRLSPSGRGIRGFTVAANSPGPLQVMIVPMNFKVIVSYWESLPGFQTGVLHGRPDLLCLTWRASQNDVQILLLILHLTAHQI